MFRKKLYSWQTKFFKRNSWWMGSTPPYFLNYIFLNFIAHKSIFLSKIEIFPKNRNCRRQKSKFSQKSKFLWIIEIFDFFENQLGIFSGRDGMGHVPSLLHPWFALLWENVYRGVHITHEPRQFLGWWLMKNFWVDCIIKLSWWVIPYNLYVPDCNSFIYPSTKNKMGLRMGGNVSPIDLMTLISNIISLLVLYYLATTH